MDRYTLRKKERPKFVENLRNLDYILLISVLILSSIGIVAINSAQESLTRRQIQGLIFSTFILFVLALFFNYDILIKGWWFYYILNIVLLVAVFVIGRSSHGASRWISLGSFSFQPSELTKIVLILFYSKFIMNYKDKLKSYWKFILCFVLLLPPLGLVYKQPDLSTTIVIAVIFATVVFVAGIDKRLVWAVVITAIPTAVFMVYSAVSWEKHPFFSVYQQNRIRAWLHPEDYSTAEALQTINSLMAIGSGQLAGKGVNNSKITSVLNSGYISESQTDLIFTVIGEEMGFIGGCAVIILLLVISIRCLTISFKAKDIAGRIIAASVAVWIGLQGFMNIGVATGSIPNTGIPLPFVSSGLTSLICVFAAVGVVLNVGAVSKKRY